MANMHSTPKARSSVYAKVLFDASAEAGSKDRAVVFRNEILDVINVMSENVEVRSLLASCDTKPENKQKLVSVICEGKTQEVKAVVQAMAENGDISVIKLVLRHLEDMISRELKLCVVDVTTAVSLDENLRDLIKKKAKNELGMDAILNEKVDKSILGGVVLGVNGKCIDASMITQLNHARGVLKAS